MGGDAKQDSDGHMLMSLHLPHEYGSPNFFFYFYQKLPLIYYFLLKEYREIFKNLCSRPTEKVRYPSFEFLQ
jgi:hypothetical protein